MHPAPIISVYAALLGFFFVVITLRVALTRNSRKLSLGDGGDPEFNKLIRGQANFAETTPIALILILLLELQGANSMTLHTLGIALLAGRLAHYLQLTGSVKHLMFRVGGMILTLGTIVSAATRLLGAVVSMSRKGNCYERAACPWGAMRSLKSSLKL